MEQKEFRNEIFLNLNILTRPAGGDKDKTKTKAKSVDRKLKNETINSLRESKKWNELNIFFDKNLKISVLH